MFKCLNQHTIHITIIKKGLPYPTQYAMNGPLDYEILLDEMIKASSILKPGKSPGYDNITNEMISISLSMYPLIFLSLFNRILKEGGALRHGPCLF